MSERHIRSRFALLAFALSSALAFVSCGGGGTGNPQDSGANKTYLKVAASDADGDPLQYQWRVTAGSIENRNSPETVWTMPEGPGVHFAYVTVSDGKGGYVEQQYAVSSDALDTEVAPHATINRPAPTITSTAWSAGRLRFSSADPLAFAVPGSAAVHRTVFLPDVQVQVEQAGAVVFSGATDVSGELSLPDLEAGSYVVKCSTAAGDPLRDCGPLVNDAPTPYTFDVAADGVVFARSVLPPLSSARNLRLYGHVALADGAVCGAENEFFGLQSAATVQLLQADGTPFAQPVRVNRFGDYAIDAAALAKGQYQLKITCERYTATVAVPPSSNALGYDGTPMELTYVIPNSRPAIGKMVANGPEGNVRGEMVIPLDGTSNSLPGALQFLAYKGYDTKLSACLYYQAIGAVSGCDAQGNLQDAITLDDWKRAHRFKPYDSGNAQVSAVYINRMDLNLVRRMYATKSSDTDIAFVVCNHPGPDGSSQREVDEVIDTGLSDQKQVACVAMEWSPSPGVNGGKPFTKFLTFGPDGNLLPSINLDGRGEKYMPGACVACHGGTQYNGRFAARGLASPSVGAGSPPQDLPSPYLGAGFLPFDTGNYLFGSGLSEAAQSQALHDLNMLVRATDNRGYPATTRLIDGWYHNDTRIALDKEYVPDEWKALDASKPGAAKFYREVVGGVCRTCHIALGSQRFDWDVSPSVRFTGLPGSTVRSHFCGGSADVAVNASMPNALISRDRLADRMKADPELASLMQTFLGCVTPEADPAYAKR
jgi:hypothetical protein